MRMNRDTYYRIVIVVLIVLNAVTTISQRRSLDAQRQMLDALQVSTMQLRECTGQLKATDTVIARVRQQLAARP